MSFDFCTGCTSTSQSALMYCNIERYNGWKIHEENGESGQYAFNCCKEEMCNNGTDWPILPEVPGQIIYYLIFCYFYGNKQVSKYTSSFPFGFSVIVFISRNLCYVNNRLFNRFVLNFLFQDLKMSMIPATSSTLTVTRFR